MVNLADLALQYALGSELLSAAITRRVGTVIHGRLDGGLLYTPAYIRRCERCGADRVWGVKGTRCPPCCISCCTLESVGGSSQQPFDLIIFLCTSNTV